MSSELLHVEDQLSYVPAEHKTSTLNDTWTCVTIFQFCHFTYVCLLINEVICAFLLDVVSMSKQPDDFIASK